MYDGSLPVCEFNASGQVTAINTFGAAGLVSRATGGASAFYAFDERGNVAQRLNGAGQVASADLYDAYGKLVAGGSAADPWGWGAQAGYYTDRETGLSLLTNRFYDPQQGRFLTRDPMGYGGGINLYGYTRNSPINRMDPLGLQDPSNPGNLATPVPSSHTPAQILAAAEGGEEGKKEAEEYTSQIGSGGGGGGGGSGEPVSPPSLSAPFGYQPYEGSQSSRLTSPTEPTYYRTFGGGANQVGRWMSPVNPTSFSDENALRNALALPNENTTEYYCEVHFPAGVRIQQGIAAPVPGQGMGGGLQTEVPFPMPLNPTWYGQPVRLTFDSAPPNPFD